MSLHWELLTQDIAENDETMNKNFKYKYFKKKMCLISAVLQTVFNKIQ